VLVFDIAGGGVVVGVGDGVVDGGVVRDGVDVVGVYGVIVACGVGVYHVVWLCWCYWRCCRLCCCVL